MAALWSGRRNRDLPSFVQNLKLYAKTAPLPSGVGANEMYPLLLPSASNSRISLLPALTLDQPQRCNTSEAPCEATEPQRFVLSLTRILVNDLVNGLNTETFLSIVK